MSRWIAVGRILRPHGLHGAVVLRRFGESEGVLSPGSVLRFGEGDGAVDRSVVASQPHGQDWIVTFAGVEGRDEALALRGSLLFVDEGALPGLPAGTYYRFQLVGLRVRTTAGEDLGVIEEILETGANDVCVVRGGRGEVLIPAIETVIQAVDVPGGEMLIHPIPGLLPGAEGDFGEAESEGRGRNA